MLLFCRRWWISTCFNTWFRGSTTRGYLITAVSADLTVLDFIFSFHIWTIAIQHRQENLILKIFFFWILRIWCLFHRRRTKIYLVFFTANVHCFLLLWSQSLIGFNCLATWMVLIIFIFLIVIHLRKLNSMNTFRLCQIFVGRNGNNKIGAGTAHGAFQEHCTVLREVLSWCPCNFQTTKYVVCRCVLSSCSIIWINLFLRICSSSVFSFTEHPTIIKI